ncbi:MAG TPA: shikimate kinase [Candidatus Rubrimentiphilum sp.]|nr:shikimate kinase [Candidatus Rubrimentiphilum sp.]
MKRFIALTGFMAAGKSTVGKKLARRLKIEFCDLDDLIIERYGSISGIFATQGEAKFREYECEVLEQLVQDKAPAVIALGGGAVTYAPSLSLLKKNAYRVFLKLSPAQTLMRIRRATNARPLLGSAPKASEVEALYARRLPLYLDSDLVVDTERMSPARAADAIADWIRRESITL